MRFIRNLKIEVYKKRTPVKSVTDLSFIKKDKILFSSEEEIERIKNISKRDHVEKLPNNCNIFFLKKTSFPRAKIREWIKDRNINIKRKIEDADIIIYDPDCLRDAIYDEQLNSRMLVFNIYEDKDQLFKIKENQYATMFNFNLETTGLTHTYAYQSSSKINFELFSQLLEIENQKFITTENILKQINKDLITIDEEKYEELRAELSNEHTVSYALTKLIHCNMETSEYFLTCLVTEFQDTIKKHSNKMVEVKSLRALISPVNFWRRDYVSYNMQKVISEENLDKLVINIKVASHCKSYPKDFVDKQMRNFLQIAKDQFEHKR